MKISSVPQLERALAKGPLPPVWLVSAEEPLTNGEAADAFRAAARAQGYTEREVYFVERSAPWDEMLGSVQAMSLFASRKILEVRMPTGKPGHGAKSLLQLIAAANEDTLVLILTEGLDNAAQKAEWVQAVDRAGVWVNITPVTTAQFPEWIRGRAKRAGLQLDDEAVTVLAARTEGNLLAADQEVQKLLLSGLTQAGAAQVLASVSSSSRYDVFQLGESLLQGDAPRALRIIDSLRAEGAEPTLVLWAILQELRALWTKLQAGPPMPGVWSSNAVHQPAAMARFRALPSPRALFRRLSERAGRVDRIIKGRLSGNAWDELTQLSLEFAGQRVLPMPRA
ncbi:MAG: DNA polymerase III subunit delta [Proteobacteria bacterium]|nr:DNA polymerase III subunit delta [Pseudomonadota bacterium]